jgi:hypothetical protein
VKAALIFTGSGPIVILTTRDSLTDPDLVGRLRAKGIRKFLAFEVPVESVRAKYHAHFDHVLLDLKEDELRVLDEDGHHVYAEFSLRDLGAPIAWEP